MEHFRFVSKSTHNISNNDSTKARSRVWGGYTGYEELEALR
jgi:hypothetical protein